MQLWIVQVLRIHNILAISFRHSPWQYKWVKKKKKNMLWDVVQNETVEGFFLKEKKKKKENSLKKINKKTILPWCAHS